MAKKHRNREKKPNRPSKKKYTNAAHLFYRDQIAPLERKYHQSMNNKQYDLASYLFEEVRKRKEEYRHILARKEKLPIN